MLETNVQDREVWKEIAEAFLPNPDNLSQVNHIDENKGNNNVENLEWVSASKNIRHSAHKYSCRINQYTLDGEFIKTWGSSHEINRELGYYQSVIIYACKNKIKQAYGYKWEYVDPTQQQRHNRLVAALTKDGEYVAEYKSAAEAARCLKISESCLRKCLYGYTKSTQGYKFQYLD